MVSTIQNGRRVSFRFRVVMFQPVIEIWNPFHNLGLPHSGKNLHDFVHFFSPVDTSQNRSFNDIDRRGMTVGILGRCENPGRESHCEPGGRYRTELVTMGPREEQEKGGHFLGPPFNYFCPTVMLLTRDSHFLIVIWPATTKLCPALLN